jgi:hypothetical protein
MLGLNRSACAWANWVPGFEGRTFTDGSAATHLIHLFVGALEGRSGEYGLSDLQFALARMAFYGKTTNFSFKAYVSGCKVGITNEACHYLHGKLVSSFLTVDEEAFIRFIVLVDTMVYHDKLRTNPPESIKLSGRASEAVKTCAASFTGKRATTVPIDGFSTACIELYGNFVRPRAVEERHNEKLVFNALPKEGRASLLQNAKIAKGVFNFQDQFSQVEESRSNALETDGVVELVGKKRGRISNHDLSDHVKRESKKLAVEIDGLSSDSDEEQSEDEDEQSDE